jgi:hypothetical protein
MTKLASLLLVLALGGCLVPVRGGGRMGDRRGGPSFALVLPVVLPPLLVIRPGISVVADLDEEVFYADGYYWARQDEQWYQARDAHGSWSQVDRGRVSPALAESPPGRYRHWRGSEQGGARREQGRSYGLEGDRD